MKNKSLMRLLITLIFLIYATLANSFGGELFLDQIKKKIENNNYNVSGIMKDKAFLKIHQKVFNQKMVNEIIAVELKLHKGIRGERLRENVFLKILAHNNLLEYRDLIERVYSKMLFEFSTLEQEQAIIFFVRYSGKYSANMKKQFDEMINDKRILMKVLAIIVNMRKHIFYDFTLKDKKPIIDYLLNRPLKPGKNDVPNLFFLIQNSTFEKIVLLPYIKKIKDKNCLIGNTVPVYNITNEVKRCVIFYKNDPQVLNLFLEVYLDMVNKKKYNDKYKSMISWSLLHLFLKHLKGKDITPFQEVCLAQLESEKNTYKRSLLIFMLCKIQDKSVFRIAIKEYDKTVVDSNSWQNLIDFFDLNDHVAIIPILQSQIKEIDCSKKAICKKNGVSEDLYKSIVKKSKAYALLAKIIIFTAKKKINVDNYFKKLGEGDLQSLKEDLLKLK